MLVPPVGGLADAVSMGFNCRRRSRLRGIDSGWRRAAFVVVVIFLRQRDVLRAAKQRVHDELQRLSVAGFRFCDLVLHDFLHILLADAVIGSQPQLVLGALLFGDLAAGVVNQTAFLFFAHGGGFSLCAGVWNTDRRACCRSGL